MSSTTDRAEINRRNGSRGGPKTPEGKARSRFNALKHGMSTKLPVLPQEDPEAYRQRLDAWMTHLEPRNPVEQFLIEQAVTASWRLERADRMETASLTDRLDGIQAQRDLKRRIEAHELARRLLPFADAQLERAIQEIYLKDPFLHFRSTDLRNGTDESGDDPESILARLVASDVGGHWVLGRWRRLRAILDRGEDWRLDDLAEALRLTGRKPLGLGTKAWTDRRAQVGKETDPRPVAELELELLRQFDPDLPADRGEARAVLSRWVGRTLEQLEPIVQAMAEREVVNRAAEADQCSIDPNERGELQRRYHLGLGRAFHRTLDSLMKVRRSLRDKGPDSSDPADPDPSPPGNDPEDRPEPTGDDHPTRPDEATGMAGCPIPEPESPPANREPIGPVPACPSATSRVTPGPDASVPVDQPGEPGRAGGDQGVSVSTDGKTDRTHLRSNVTDQESQSWSREGSELVAQAVQPDSGALRQAVQPDLREIGNPKPACGTRDSQRCESPASTVPVPGGVTMVASQRPVEPAAALPGESESTERTHLAAEPPGESESTERATAATVAETPLLRAPVAGRGMPHGAKSTLPAEELQAFLPWLSDCPGRSGHQGHFRMHGSRRNPQPLPILRGMSRRLKNPPGPSREKPAASARETDSLQPDGVRRV